MLRVALTGGIGSGKTTVANLFSTFGVTIIDADIIAHALTAPGQPLLTKIIDHFGTTILTEANHLDRAQLRQIIFRCPAEKQWLEDLLHPVIRQIMSEKIHFAQPPYCLLVIPLLAEAKQPFDFIDRVCVVDSLPDLQIARIRQRNNYSDTQINAILAQQSSREQRLTLADDVIHNNGSLDELLTQVEQLHQRYWVMSQA